MRFFFAQHFLLVRFQDLGISINIKQLLAHHFVLSTAYSEPSLNAEMQPLILQYKHHIFL